MVFNIDFVDVFPCLERRCRIQGDDLYSNKAKYCLRFFPLRSRIIQDGRQVLGE